MQTNIAHAEPSSQRQMTEALLSVDGAADYMGISRWTVYRMAREGSLRTLRAGTRLRFRRADIDAYLERDRLDR